METKIDHERVGTICHSTAGVQFALIGINHELEKNGGDISKLNLTKDGEPIMGEHEFVEMIMGVVSAPFDPKKITKAEKATLNGLSAYVIEKQQPKK